MIDFYEIWQKYSKYFRIEFACFSFHVGLLFDQLFVFQIGHCHTIEWRRQSYFWCPVWKTKSW